MYRRGSSHIMLFEGHRRRASLRQFILHVAHRQHSGRLDYLVDAVPAANVIPCYAPTFTVNVSAQPTR